MKLNVLERITLMSLLPVEGNYITYKILTDLKLQLSFSEAELKEYEIIISENKATWGKSGDKEIKIGERAKEIIVNLLKKIDENNKLNANNISLYEKFIVL
jgi:hypothetical protein